MTPVLAEGLTNESFNEMIEKMLASLHTFASSGSGWIQERLVQIRVSFARYRPIRASSFIELPLQLRNDSSLLNIRNHDDNNCFTYCYQAAFCFQNNIIPSLPNVRDIVAVSNPDAYRRLDESTVPNGEFSMPMGFHDIPKFECLNNTQVNVFGIEKKQLFPMLVSSNTSYEMRLDLLLLYESNKHHYVLIKDLVKLFCSVMSIEYRSSFSICRNCFWLCTYSDETVLNEHVSKCSENAPATVRMPTPHNNLYKFKNWSATWFAPVVIYFDFESFLNPVHGCQSNQDAASSQVLEVHRPCGFALAVIEHGNEKPIYTHLDSSDDCMTTFVNLLHQLAKDIYGKKRRYPFYKGDRNVLREDDAKSCWICQTDFTPEDDKKDLDHCHYSGKFLGWAHPKCNRARRNSRFISVVGHNIQNYDLHHLCLALQECHPSTTISVIPASDEKYISMELGVHVDTIINKRNQPIKVYEYLRFIDSYKLFNASLEKLVDTLPDTAFGIVKSMFPDLHMGSLPLLKQKGHYPYSYVTDRTKFAEKSLPPLQEWKNTLENGAVAITEDELRHAQRMWNLLSCEKLQDYHDGYLRLDVALLACCAEYCRRLSFDTYGLDIIQFYTAPNMARDAALRITKARVELLTDQQHLHMIEPAVRGGLASVFDSRLFVANNKLLPGYNSEAESTFGLLVDANNLYGGVMQTEKLPLGGFKFNETITIDEILATADCSSIGYYVEVDLEYPTNLHDKHSDFPLAPEKRVVENEWLSEYQHSIKNQNRLPSSNVKKLLQTLFNKWNYVVHYKLLQLYVKLGLRVIKVHKVLQFTQSPWLEPYISLNSRMRKEATSVFAQNYYKLMNNAMYGKTCESKRTRSNVKISRDADETTQIVSKFEFDHYKIFGDNMVALSSRPKTISWDTPTIVGASILDLSKLVMYRFHYEVMQTHFNCRLLYSDTDSLLYKIYTENLVDEFMAKPFILDEFDFSNYPPDHCLYNAKNKRQVLKFKDEFAAFLITEFICLKPKLYSILSQGKPIVSLFNNLYILVSINRNI